MTDPSAQSPRDAASQPQDVMPPPSNIGGILRQLGPGLITAGAVVGSGELIATTKTGAQAGFWLLWLIVIGCVIKVFCQVELGRYTISSGKATMAALNEVPGPRLRVNWILWYWLVMFVVSLAQLGGIIGGVGQATAMSLPIDGSFNRLLAEQDAWDAEASPIRAELRRMESLPSEAALRDRKAAEGRIETAVAERLGRPRPNENTPGFYWTDDIAWAAIFTVLTVVLLVAGRYRMIQDVSTLLVAAFTAVTVFCVFALQTQSQWAVHWSDLAAGMSFRLPPAVEGLKSPLVTALAAFGIIGVGTNELIAYPYFCVEKGYARFAGSREASGDWAMRANGWIRVMHWDVGASMLVYTFATLAFYLLGAAVLHREHLDPNGTHMIRTLSEMYVPVFGTWAKWLFMVGAFAVLYSTFFAANAGHTRVAADAIRVFQVGARSDQDFRWWVRAFCVFLPLFALATCVLYRHPVQLVLASGVMQAMMLPMLAAATLYFRYRKSDARTMPGRAWDVLLWLSSAGLLVAGMASGGFALRELLGF